MSLKKKILELLFPEDRQKAELRMREDSQSSIENGVGLIEPALHGYDPMSNGAPFEDKYPHPMGIFEGMSDIYDPADDHYDPSEVYDDGIYDMMDDMDLNDPLDSRDNNEDVIIEQLRAKGINTASLFDVQNDYMMLGGSFHGLRDDFDFEHDMRMLDEWIEKLEAPLLELQESFERKDTVRQQQITKEKCWRPKKN